MAAVCCDRVNEWQKDDRERGENVWKRAGRQSKPTERRFPASRVPDEQGSSADATPARKLPDGQWLEPLCGLQSVLALYGAKAPALERLFFDPETGPALGEVCRHLAKERKVYRQVEPAELTRIGGTQSHGGVVAIVRRRPLEPATPKAAEFWGRAGLPLLILDGVADPHTLGGVARVACFFGVEKLLLADIKRQARPSAAAYRSARGGLDRMDIRLVENLPVFLKSIQASHFVVGLDGQGVALPEAEAALRSAATDGKPVALVIGHDEHGLGVATKEACQSLLSLNASSMPGGPGLVVETALLLQRCVAQWGGLRS